MTRTIFVIRHGQSEGTRFNRALFGKLGGALTKAGIQEARLLHSQLKELKIDVDSEPVVVSELQRTRQTATEAGFRNIVTDAVLNEVNTGLPQEVLEKMLENKEVPGAAIEAARAILKSPPKQKVWVTHGLVIAGLAHELGVPAGELFIPSTGSLTVFHLR